MYLVRSNLSSINEITSEEQLEEVLSQPTEEDIHDLHQLDGDILILGAGGKMGPSLARRAVRASQAAGVQRRVIAVARFSNRDLIDQLSKSGVEVIAADLFDTSAIQRLPDAANVIYMAARKFGTVGEEFLTWATNAYLPGVVADRYRRSRIVTWSTGNVYPLSPSHSHGPTEECAVSPVGEYAQSALARERIFEYFSRLHEAEVAILRLNYAVELRYGVLVDLATKIAAQQPIDLSMGAVNIIWQGYANSVCLRSLLHVAKPPFILNVTSPETYTVRWLAEQLGEEMGIQPIFGGHPGDRVLLNNASKCRSMFGPSDVSVEQLIVWVAKWIRRGGTLWNKPTRFEVKDGGF